MEDQLQNESILIGELPLCAVLLMNNSLYPWIVLMPKRENIVEIMELKPEDRAVFVEEIAAASKVMKETYWPDKLNVAALGNLVPQLHVHIIARFKTDEAWPEVIWGKGVKPYCEKGTKEAVAILQREFGKVEGFVC